MGTLTARRQRFVEEYLADPELNATRAYERAGYKARGGAARVCAHRLLADPDVAAAIAEAMRERSERVQVTADSVVQRLDEVANRCLQAVPMVQSGLPTGEYRFDSAGANRALELLGKHLGMFAERRILEGGERPVRVEGLGDALRDAEVRRLIADLDARLADLGADS